MRTTRRVVVARRDDGEGRVVVDGPPPLVRTSQHYEGVEIADLWVHSASPRFDGPDETVAETYGAGADIHHQLVEIPAGTFMDRHRTWTIDVITILRGQIVLIEDDQELVLAAGDHVVQLGSFHAWENRGSEPCTMLVASTVIRDRTGAVSS